jgi:hypothetical protein
MTSRAPFLYVNPHVISNCYTEDEFFSEEAMREDKWKNIHY